MATAASDTTRKIEYSPRRVGHPFSKEYRIYFERAKDKVPVSPFHDIPLYHNRDNDVLNMVVEIPRWTNAKLEVLGPPTVLTPLINLRVDH